MLQDTDLNIDNYDFDDILCLFKLPYHYSENDLKSAKKWFTNSSDKSGLDKDFSIFSKAYKLLYKVFVFDRKLLINNVMIRIMMQKMLKNFQRKMMS